MTTRTMPANRCSN